MCPRTCVNCDLRYTRLSYSTILLLLLSLRRIAHSFIPCTNPLSRQDRKLSEFKHLLCRVFSWKSKWCWFWRPELRVEKRVGTSSLGSHLLSAAHLVGYLSSTLKRVDLCEQTTNNKCDNPDVRSTFQFTKYLSPFLFLLGDSVLSFELSVLQSSCENCSLDSDNSISP